MNFVLKQNMSIPIAEAVLPVPGWPAIRTARPAILPSYSHKRTVEQLEL